MKICGYFFFFFFFGGGGGSFLSILGLLFKKSRYRMGIFFGPRKPDIPSLCMKKNRVYPLGYLWVQIYTSTLALYGGLGLGCLK